MFLFFILGFQKKIKKKKKKFLDFEPKIERNNKSMVGLSLSPCWLNPKHVVIPDKQHSLLTRTRSNNVNGIKQKVHMELADRLPKPTPKY